jgi:hypothetical protein
MNIMLVSVTGPRQGNPALDPPNRKKLFFFLLRIRGKTPNSTVCGRGDYFSGLSFLAHAARRPSITPTWNASPFISGGVGGAWPAKPAAYPACQAVGSCLMTIS